MRLNLKLFAALALIAIGAGAVGVAVFLPRGSSTASDYITTPVTRTTVSADVVATGTVSARATYGLAFGAPAQLVVGSGAQGGTGGGSWVVATVGVGVGDTVTAGQVLAAAETTDLEVQLAIAKANLAAARARLIADQGGPTADVRAAANDAIRQARIAYSGALAARSNTAAQNELTLSQAERAVQQAEENLAAAQAGPSADVIQSAQDSLAAAQLSVQNAEQNLAATQAQNQLSISQAQQALSAAQSDLQAANAKLAAANAKLAADQAADPVDPSVISADQAAVAQAEAAVSGAQQAVTAAQKNLDTATLNGQRSELQAQQALASAQLGLTSAQHAYAQKTTPSSDAIKAAEQALQAARDNLAAARLKVEQASSSSDQQVSQAKVSLDSARTSYTTKTAPASAQQIAADEASLASAQASLASAQQTLERATLRSPADGTISQVNIEPGVAAPSGYAIVVQSRALEVSALFAESDVPSLAAGQAASISVPATGDQLSAPVTRITPVASTAAGSSVVSYQVIVDLESSPAGVRPGMSADVTVTTAAAADVLAVPAIALQGTAGGYTVRVLAADGSVQTRSVDVGLVTSSMAEVRTGLAEGERVIIGTRSQRTGGSTTPQGGFGGFGGFGGGNRNDGRSLPPGVQP